MRKLLIGIGVLFITAAVIWKVGVVPGMEKRFPANWHYNFDILGRTSYADASTGKFPDGTTLKDAPINISKRDITVSQVNTDGTVELTDHFVTYDTELDDITWELTTKATVDSVTGKYTKPEYANDYYFIPRNAQKTTYSLRNNYLNGVPFTFQNEENISGISTYHYGYKGDYNNTGSNPDVKLEPDQTIICFNLAVDFWVEPTTGEIVKYHEWCEGDWVVNTKTNEKLYAISRWGSDNTGDDLIRRAAEVRGMLNTTNLNRLYIPLLLVVVGLATLAFALLPPFFKNRGKKTTEKNPAKTTTSEVKAAL
jgi:hypothetical protein